MQPQAEDELRGYIDAMVENNASALFFTEDWDWSSETEYRLLLRGETGEEEYVMIRDCLAEVIVGPRFPPVHTPLVRMLCGELEALPMRLIGWNGRPIITSLRDEYRP